MFSKLTTHEKIKNHDRCLPSIDKIDPSKGFIKTNVVFCTRSANSMKHDLQLKKFIEYSKNFKSRYCVDFSEKALELAKINLED